MKLEAASSEAGKRRNFFSNRNRSLEHGPRSDKKIENSEQFSKCIQKARREHGGKRLGWHRDGNQPVAGPTTWVIGCKSTRNKNRTGKMDNR